MATTAGPAMATASSVQNRRSRALHGRHDIAEMGSIENSADKLNSRLPCMRDNIGPCREACTGPDRRQATWQAGAVGIASRTTRAPEMTSSIALIVAAGAGTRFGGEVPKQYLPLAGRAVLRHSIEAFLNHHAISGIRVVISPEHRALYDAATVGLPILSPVAGGASRQESVLNGLESLTEARPDRVLI